MSDPRTEEELLDEELAKIEAAQDDEEAAKDLEIKRARVKYSKELGAEGKAFAVVETVEGVCVVQRVTAIVMKRWRDATSGDKEATPQKAFEVAQAAIVQPDVATFKAWYASSDSVATKCALAVLRLHGEVAREASKKR